MVFWKERGLWSYNWVRIPILATTHKFFDFMAKNAYILWALFLSSLQRDDLIIFQG